MSAIETIQRPPAPIAAFNNLRRYPYAFFLDGAGSFGRLGRFSFLGCDPALVFKSKRDDISLEWRDGRKENFKSNPFLALKGIFKRCDPARETDLRECVKGIPFTSGWVGYFSYDLKNFIEELPDAAADDIGIPDCILGFYDKVLIYDNVERKAYIASCDLPGLSSSEKYGHGAPERLAEFKDRISSAAVGKAGIFKSPPSALESNFSKPSYLDAIKKAKAYIKNGDIYQVNLSQRFSTKLNIEPVELYSRLRDFSPAPFSSFLDFKDVIILSSSPERFLMKQGRYIETRPIKGTAPRGKDKIRDLESARWLTGSAKDRAEHIMIVDLERNDLGRICEYGSVKPTERIVLEKYSNVFHLVSTVAGRLKAEAGPIDCLLVAFPGGSITGAPKIRAMEIIEELEPVKRSIYTGAIGYISSSGNMDMSIVIRTFLIKEGNVYFQVGGGIVADSDPEKEYEETLHKAGGLMRSLGVNAQNVR